MKTGQGGLDIQRRVVLTKYERFRVCPCVEVLDVFTQEKNAQSNVNVKNYKVTYANAEIELQNVKQRSLRH